MPLTEAEEAALRDLLDRQALSDVVVRYCHGVDRTDGELLGSAYHPDAFVDHGAVFRGSATDFVAFAVQRVRTQLACCQHYVTNQRFDVSGDVARGETYVVSVSVDARGAQPVRTVLGGRYLDDFERRAGEWRIGRREVIVEWTSRTFEEQAQTPKP